MYLLNHFHVLQFLQTIETFSFFCLAENAELSDLALHRMWQAVAFVLNIIKIPLIWCLLKTKQSLRQTFIS